MPTLQLTVTQAQIKKSSELIGKMDNYVLVKVNQGGKVVNQYKSTIVPGAKDKPITWNYTFNIPINTSQKDTRLQLWVKDEDMISDDSNGKGWVNIQRCLMFQPGRNSYQLRLFSDTKKQEYAGDLYFTTQYV